MNVRSVSPEGGGILLPFRGNRDDDGDRDGDRGGEHGTGLAPDHGGDPVGDHGADRARDHGGDQGGDRLEDRAARAPQSVASPSPTVVHLTARRRPGAEEGRGRPRWQRVGVVLAAVAVVVGGVVAASLTGVLPLSTERPVPRPLVSAPPTSASVEKGNLPAAYGLCKAFDRAAQRGDDIATAQAFRNLAHAAGGASRVSAYCAPFQRLDRGRAG